MAEEYRVFFLTYGQMPPKGTTSMGLSGGGIMWIGEEGTFPTKANLGNRMPNDKNRKSAYDNRLAEEKEVNEYKKRNKQ